MNTLPIQSNFRIFAKRDPFSADLVEAEGHFGLSVRDVLGTDDDHFSVMLDDKPLRPCEWDFTRPLPNQTLLVCPVPAGDDMRSLLMSAAVISAAVFAAPLLPAFGGLSAGAATTFWQASIMAVGSLTAQALVTPPALDR